MSLPILYTFRRCPYAMRARLALRYAGAELEMREVALRAKPAELLAASSKGTVPVLVLPGGVVLAQSLDIMLWALDQADPDAWLHAAPWVAQAEWIQRNDIEFKPLLDRYKYPQRFPEASAEHYREAALDLMLRPLEKVLTGKAWLFGAQPSVADMALLPFIRQFAAVDAAWFEAAPLPALQAWLSAFVASDLFQAVMRDRSAPWVAPAAAAG
nr:glutathione S-transferase [uncultured Roseateles sp.]